MFLNTDIGIASNKSRNDQNSDKVNIAIARCRKLCCVSQDQEVPDASHGRRTMLKKSGKKRKCF